MEKHKACPFCRVLDTEVTEAQPIAVFYAVVCPNCLAQGPLRATEAEAWEAWDRRDDD